MKPYPVRLPEGLVDDLEQEADERDLSTAEYIRKILRRRDSTQEYTQADTQEYTQAVDELEERVGQLEKRVTALEEPTPAREEVPKGTDFPPRDPKGQRLENPPSTGEDAQYDDIDVVAWLRQRGEPANRSEIVDELFPDGAPIKADSWWRRHAKPQLEEAGSRFVRNKGWMLEEKAGVYDPTEEFQ